ncbi:MAG: globin domain-containing protein, partial [Gammaproteobacteria bacterium]|nr:globin domain-containing protein [Gammaproteobacteria bacterium]
MSLTPRQVLLIQNSFAKVEPIADQAADIFYNKLFEYDPSIRDLFQHDMKQQGRKLMSMLKLAVAGLDDLGKLVPALKSLADRHIDYGVEIEDYTPVGNALLFALKKGLGRDFTAETRTAWIAVYKVIADTMRSHSYPNF